MDLLDVALLCIRRGWHVFPCRPKTKEPAVKGGFHAATLDEAQVRAWWSRWPDANVAIATGASGLTVLDIDSGISNRIQLLNFLVNTVDTVDDPYTVRTGRRPGFGVQVYFRGGDLKSVPWADGDVSGDIRSATGYVMAEGSTHPSGAFYERLLGAPGAPTATPGYVRALKSLAKTAATDDGGPITAARNATLTSIAGRMRNASLPASMLEANLLQVNAERCVPPLPEAEVVRIAANAANWSVPEEEIAVTIGKAEPKLAPGEPVDWRTRYMTAEAYHDVKPPVFLIDGFLVQKSIAMLAGPVAQRKSIIALNIAHSLCTGEPLFGFFNVNGGHERVVYLCPEMGAASFVKRIKGMGLGDYIGKTLFVQTMSEQPTALDELDGELPGAVVLVDTITRFVDGDENSSADMRLFAKRVFRLANQGATVVLLHHSKKGSSGTLDDGLRGSSELAAFVDSCWVTELEDPKNPYESLSKMRNVKQRDFESDPFKLRPTAGSYGLTMDGDPGPEATLKSKAEDAALGAFREIVSASPQMGINKIIAELKKAGHGRGANWVRAQRAALSDTGVVLTD